MSFATWLHVGASNRRDGFLWISASPAHSLRFGAALARLRSADYASRIPLGLRQVQQHSLRSVRFAHWRCAPHVCIMIQALVQFNQSANAFKAYGAHSLERACSDTAVSPVVFNPSAHSITDCAYVHSYFGVYTSLFKRRVFWLYFVQKRACKLLIQLMFIFVQLRFS